MGVNFKPYIDEMAKKTGTADKFWPIKEIEEV